MGILDKYVAKQVLFTIILVSFFLLILVALITFIDQMRYIGRGEIDFTFLIGFSEVCKHGTLLHISDRFFCLWLMESQSFIFSPSVSILWHFHVCFPFAPENAG